MASRVHELSSSDDDSLPDIGASPSHKPKTPTPHLVKSQAVGLTLSSNRKEAANCGVKLSTVRPNGILQRCSKEPYDIDLTLSSDTEDDPRNGKDDKDDLLEGMGRGFEDKESCSSVVTVPYEGIEVGNEEDKESSISEATVLYGTQEDSDIDNQIVEATEYNRIEEANEEDKESCISESTLLYETEEAASDIDNQIVEATQYNRIEEANEEDKESCISETTDVYELQETRDADNQILEATDLYEGIEDVNDMGNFIYDVEEEMQQDLNEMDDWNISETSTNIGGSGGIQNAKDEDDIDTVKEILEEDILETDDMGICTGEDADTEEFELEEVVRKRSRGIFSSSIRPKAPRLSPYEESQDLGICLLGDSPDLQESVNGEEAKADTATAGKVSKGTKKPSVRLTKEEREAARKEKEREKEHRKALREQRAREKKAEKARREEERSMRKAMRPGECIKLLVVELDRRLVEAAEGGRVLSQLQEAGLTCRVVEGRVASSVIFFRVDPLSGKESQAEEAVVLMRMEDLAAAINKQLHGGESGGSLCQLCNEWKEALNAPNLALVVCGVDDYFRQQTCEKQRQIRSKIFEEETNHRRKASSSSSSSTSSRPMSRVDMEKALVVAQMECRVNHRFMADAGKAALYVQQVAKAVAELPFKRERSEAQAQFSWYAEGSVANSVKVDRSTGVGLLKLWQQQLRQFSNIGVEVAQAVTSKYPSPASLVQAYRACNSQREAKQLLVGLRVRRGVGPLASEQCIGKEFSRKLHLFFTSTDPHQTLAYGK